MKQGKGKRGGRATPRGGAAPIGRHADNGDADDFDDDDEDGDADLGLSDEEAAAMDAALSAELDDLSLAEEAEETHDPRAGGSQRGRPVPIKPNRGRKAREE